MVNEIVHNGDAGQVPYANPAAATNLLRSGATLEAVASLLRHESVDSTAHYAKVDVGLLAEVAQPWPVEASC